LNSFETFVFLTALSIILVGVAQRLSLSYPILLVVGGLLLGYIPGLTLLNLEPTFILVLVLPPILYYAAYTLPHQEFKRHLKEIIGLALGLVLFTTAAIGIFFKWLFPELPWALAFTFGAIISPPDAVSATAILKRFTISERLLGILEGESLINDATGLVLYRVGVVALLSGTFSFFDAGFEFVRVATGGILIGVICGFLFHLFSSRFFEPVLAVIFTFPIPYLTYLIADRLEVSGVLAVVMCGLIGSRLLITKFSSLTRVVGWATWDTLIILLNCFVFFLIGLQLHEIAERLSPMTLLTYVGYGFILTLAAMAIRFFWVFFQYSFLYFQKYTYRGKKQVYNDSMIISWAGMRGIVSIAAALSLPYTMLDGTPLPGRDIVILLSFIVIFFSLIIPGLTFSKLMRVLKIPHTHEQIDTKNIRHELLKVAQEEMSLLKKAKILNEKEHAFLSSYFNLRHDMLEIVSHQKMITDTLDEARKKILSRKRSRLIELWEQEEINDHLFNLIARELDLEEVYLARAELST
jgi:CPA1 family monovalent cation:H+ antiporter